MRRNILKHRTMATTNKYELKHSSVFRNAFRLMRPKSTRKQIKSAHLDKFMATQFHWLIANKWDGFYTFHVIVWRFFCNHFSKYDKFLWFFGSRYEWQCFVSRDRIESENGCTHARIELKKPTLEPHSLVQIRCQFVCCLLHRSSKCLIHPFICAIALFLLLFLAVIHLVLTICCALSIFILFIFGFVVDGDGGGAFFLLRQIRLPLFLFMFYATFSVRFMAWNFVLLK